VLFIFLQIGAAVVTAVVLSTDVGQSRRRAKPAAGSIVVAAAAIPQFTSGLRAQLVSCVTTREFIRPLVNPKESVASRSCCGAR